MVKRDLNADEDERASTTGDHSLALAFGKGNLATITGQLGVAIASDEAIATTGNSSWSIAIAQGQKAKAISSQGSISIAGKGGTAFAGGYGGIAINTVAGVADASEPSVAQTHSGCAVITNGGATIHVEKDCVAVALDKVQRHLEPDSPPTIVKGDEGTLVIIGYRDGSSRRQFKVGYIGSDDIVIKKLDPNTPYKLGTNNTFQKVRPDPLPKKEKSTIKEK